MVYNSNKEVVLYHEMGFFYKEKKQAIFYVLFF